MTNIYSNIDYIGDGSLEIAFEHYLMCAEFEKAEDILYQMDQEGLIDPFIIGSVVEANSIRLLKYLFELHIPENIWVVSHAMLEFNGTLFNEAHELLVMWLNPKTKLLAKVLY